MSSMRPSNLSIETLKKMFEENKRFDSRGLLDLKDLKIEKDVSNKAEGSVRVRLGNTEVLVGVKLAPGNPYPDSLDKGNLMVSGDLLPLASPRFELGPPGFDAIEVPRLIDRGIRESGMIDLSKLVIKEGEKVWTVFIDIYPINDDGALIDAASIGAVAALQLAKIPELDENGNPDYDNKKKHLPLNAGITPIAFSFFKLGNSIILHPTREEEEACDTRVTFSISKWNGKYVINSCQKNNHITFTQEEILKIVSTLSEKYNEIEQKLKKVL